MKRKGPDVAKFVSAYNTLCPLFNVAPLKGSSSGAPRVAEPETGTVLLIDENDERVPLLLPESLSLSGIADSLEQAFASLQPVDTVLVSRLSLTDDDEASVQRCLELVCLRARRVSFLHTIVEPLMAIELVASLAKLLRESSALPLSSIRMPLWSHVPQGASEQFATALWDLCCAVRETAFKHQMQAVELEQGTTTLYLPASQRHLPQVLATTFILKSRLRWLTTASPEQEQELHLLQSSINSDKQSLKIEFTCQNPALQGPATFERKLLDRPALSVKESISDSLHQGWRLFLEALVDCLLNMALDLDNWSVFEEPPDPRALEVVRAMADEALLYTLKLAESKRRPGLPNLFSLILPYFHSRNQSTLARLVPETFGYLQKIGASLALG